LTQRKTQTANYWQKQFTPNSKDIEAIYNQILEKNKPVALDVLAIDLVKRHCDAEEREVRDDLQEGRFYQPKESYKVDERLIFPALDFVSGSVVSTREGQHPEYGSFTVVNVDFNGSTREFAANLQANHPLNSGDQGLASLQGIMTPDELYQTYQGAISSTIKAALDAHEDFVEFHDQYFLRDLLPEFHEGLFNIADAAIDINQAPLSVDALINQMGLAAEGQEISEITRFSVSYQLANDERFDDVGPTGQILWYLERMSPPESHHPPRRLQPTGDQSYNTSNFDEDLLDLLAEIDDETTAPDDFAPVDAHAQTITVVLNYPHWRVGTLPLTPKTEPFFPKSYYNPVMFEFIDGRTGNSFPGWTVWEHGYIFGLEQWYQQNKLPVGAYITIKRTDDPMRLVVDFQATRAQRDWVRMASITGHRLNFQMSPSPLGCEYDELMIIGDADPSKTDAFWVKAEERNTPVFNLLCDIFPELSKLNPQSTVHAKTLYSAVNVVRRVGPGVVFEELVSQPCFIPMNHGYWTYDPSLRD